MNTGLLSFGLLAPLILLLYFVCISLEITADRLLHRSWYQLNDTISTLIMFFINRITGVAAGTFMLLLLSVVYPLAPFKLHGLSGAIFTFILVDFLFFVQHRCFHTNDFLAAFHEVHHSSPYFNFTTTLRASFLLPLINPVFYLPAVIIGCEPLTVVLSFTFVQVFQFFLHTQSVPSLGYLEGLLNTPSAHRVHHGVESSQYQSNLGGVLLVWDRMFNSYLPEQQTLRFGVKGISEENFWVAQIRPFVSMVTRWQNQKRFF